jgi:hypothetical protein
MVFDHSSLWLRYSFGIASLLLRIFFASASHKCEPIANQYRIKYGTGTNQQQRAYQQHKEIKKEGQLSAT